MCFLNLQFLLNENKLGELHIGIHVYLHVSLHVGIHEVRLVTMYLSGW